MDEQVKDKWVRALRSGDYKQGRDALRRDDKYCCLGVLCDLVGVEWKWHKQNGLYSAYTDGGASQTMPPAPVMDAAGLVTDAAARLITYNDAGNTFQWIADWIEGNL